MNPIINYASGSPSNPLPGYSSVQDLKLDNPIKLRPVGSK